MQRHEEPLVVITAKITETQNQRVRDLMMVLGKNRSEIIRWAIETAWQRHCQEVNSQLPIESEA
jgi:hypothetical protein